MNKHSTTAEDALIVVLKNGWFTKEPWQYAQNAFSIRAVSKKVCDHAGDVSVGSWGRIPLEAIVAKGSVERLSYVLELDTYRFSGKNKMDEERGAWRVGYWCAGDFPHYFQREGVAFQKMKLLVQNFGKAPDVLASMMHAAVQNGFKHCLGYLFQLEPPPPIDFAFMVGDSSFMAGVEQSSKCSQTVLAHACYCDSAEIADFLLAHGASPSPQSASGAILDGLPLEPPFRLSIWNDNDESPLHWAVGHRNYSLVEKLLDAGAEINLVCDQFHNACYTTALTWFEKN